MPAACDAWSQGRANAALRDDAAESAGLRQVLAFRERQDHPTR